MPINSEEILSVVSQLAEQENLYVTIKESVKGACIVGGSAFAGGILGGPVGLCIGGIAGSLAGFLVGGDRYRSVADIIMNDMTPTQQERLADSVKKIIDDLKIEDFTLLLPLILNNAGMKAFIITEIAKFIQNEVGMSVAT